MEGMKKKISVTVETDLINKIDKDVTTQRFRNRSHAVEFALMKLEENKELKDRLQRIRDIIVANIQPAGYSSKMKQILLYNEQVETLARLTKIDLIDVPKNNGEKKQ